MNCRLTRGIAVSILSFFAGTALSAQENQAKRLASIVGVAVDERGKLISRDEFDETYGFLVDAQQVATRLNTYEAPATRAILDSMTTAVAQRKPPAVVRELHQHFAGSLGTAGAMDLPKLPLDTMEGHAIYNRSCASCHGMT